MTELEHLRIWKNRLHKVCKIGYWLLFLSMVIYRFLNTTQLFEDIDVLYAGENLGSSLFRLLFLQPQWLIVVVTFGLYLTAEKTAWKEMGMMLLFSISLLYAGHQVNADALISYLLLLPGAHYVSFEKLIRAYVAVGIVLTVGIIAGAFTGTVDNLVWTLWDGRTRASFGFIYPTDFVAHVFFLILAYWYVRGRKISYMEMAAVLALAWLTMKYCITRCSSALIAVTAVVMLYNRLFSGRLKLEKIVLENMPFLMALVTTGLGLLYSSDKPIFVQWNGWLSGRLNLIKKGADLKGFHLWGSNMQMIGNGGKTSSPSRYFYIDSAYMQLALLYGIILLAVVLILLTIVCKKAVVQEQWVLLWIVALACVHGVIEQHLIELEYFPFFLAVFGTIVKEEPTGEKKGFVERLHGKKE